MFRGSVKSTGYPLHSPVSSSLPLTCTTVCHHISTGLYQYVYSFFITKSILTSSSHPITCLVTPSLRNLSQITGSNWTSCHEDSSTLPPIIQNMTAKQTSTSSLNTAANVVSLYQWQILVTRIRITSPNTASHNTKHDGHANFHILTEYCCERCFSLPVTNFSDQNPNNIAQTHTNVSADSHSINGHNLRYYSSSLHFATLFHFAVWHLGTKPHQIILQDSKHLTFKLLSI